MFNYTLEEIFEGGNVTNDEDCNFTSKVYFLIKENSIVYVGQSMSLANRISQHKDKDFDNVSFICVPEHAASDVEAHYIVKFNPEFNRSIPGNNLFISKGKISKAMNSIGKKLLESIEPAYVEKPKSEKSISSSFYKKGQAVGFIKEICEKLGIEHEPITSEMIKRGKR